MAKEANVKLTVNASGFSQTIDALKVKTRAFAAEAKKNFGDAFGSGAVSGFKAMGSEIRNLGGQLKSHIATAAMLGGALSFGGAIRQQVMLQGTLEDLAFKINAATGAQRSWQDLQAEFVPLAEKTGRGVDQIAQVYDQLVTSMKSTDQASDALEGVLQTSIATGKPVEQLAKLAGVIGAKWGAAGSQMQDALAGVIELGARANMPLEELAEDFDELASIGTIAGLKGADGLRVMTGMAEKMRPHLKGVSEILTGMDQLFEKVRQTSVVEGLGKDSGAGFKPKDVEGSGTDRVRKMLEAAGGKGKLDKFMKVALETEFTGREEQVAFKTLADPFVKAFQEAKAAGAKNKEAMQAGLAAYDAALAELGKASLSAADVQKKYAERLNSPQAKLDQAMQKVQSAFSKPEMIEAINKLAEVLPEFAQGLTKVITFVTHHPMLSAGMAVGGKVAMAGVSGFAGDFASKMMGKLKLEDKAADMFGKAASHVFVDGVAKSGGWAKVAGSFGMIAGAAIVAYQAGQQVIDQELDEHFKQRLKGAGAASEAESMVKHGVGSDAERKAAADALRAEINKMQKEGGPGLAADFFGSYASAFGDVEHPITEFNNRLKRMNEALAALEADTAKKKGDEAAKSLERVARAAAGAADAMANVQPPPGTPSGSSKGPPRPGNSGGGAGHVPTPG